MSVAIGLIIFITFALIIAREIYTLIYQIKGTIIINFKSKKFLSNKNKVKLRDAINSFIELGIIEIVDNKLIWKQETLSPEQVKEFNNSMNKKD
ncbi:hypothetical protein [Spiroplasma endosymbiont of Diplazon laetatorius]|uniref:hypothetical protein n=1 Tax=Spiroplasma endosymbiont of Diplazon laetatorius TaxID=3066322 RepID=UPI0030D2223F